MSKNILLDRNTYTGINTLTIPVVGGGTAIFTDNDIMNDLIVAAKFNSVNNTDVVCDNNATINNATIPDTGKLVVDEGCTLTVTGDLYAKDVTQIQGSITLTEGAALKSTFNNTPLTLISHNPDESATFMMNGSANFVFSSNVEGSSLPSNLSMVISGDDVTLSLESSHIITPDGKIVLDSGIVGSIPSGKTLYIYGEVVLKAGASLTIDEGGSIVVARYDGDNNTILNNVYGSGTYTSANSSATAGTFTIEDGATFINNGTLSGDGTYPA